jgi:hypothetical protein
MLSAELPSMIISCIVGHAQVFFLRKAVKTPSDTQHLELYFIYINIIESIWNYREKSKFNHFPNVSFCFIFIFNTLCNPRPTYSSLQEMSFFPASVLHPLLDSLPDPTQPWWNWGTWTEPELTQVTEDQLSCSSPVLPSHTVHQSFQSCAFICASLRKGTHFLHLYFYFFIFWVYWMWTQRLMLARQALYHLSHSASPVFRDRVSQTVPGA